MLDHPPLVHRYWSSPTQLRFCLVLAGGPWCWTKLCLFIDTGQVLSSIFLLSLLTTEIPLLHFQIQSQLHLQIQFSPEVGRMWVRKIRESPAWVPLVRADILPHEKRDCYQGCSTDIKHFQISETFLSSYSEPAMLTLSGLYGVDHSPQDMGF